MENSKTQKEFYEFADIWYQRTHALRRVWQESNKPIEKKVKAFRLWEVMFERILKVSQIAIKLNQAKPQRIYEKGDE